MTAVVQRVKSASVSIQGQVAASIEVGLVALVGVCAGDGAREVRWMAEKLCALRVFEDASGKMNRPMEEVGGSLLLVPNFTVCGDAGSGRRPSFDRAAPFDVGKAQFGLLESTCRELGARVEVGEFGAEMLVSLQNDGPVTLVIDTPAQKRPN